VEALRANAPGKRIPEAAMRAAVLAQPRAAHVETVPTPEAERGTALVRIDGCGVCASSLPLWEGRPWFDYPFAPGVPGHEAWGRLDDGTPVAVLTQHGFAEWTVVPERNLVELPPVLRGRPFPGEALACAVNVVRRSEMHAGLDVAVVGLGFLGSTVAQLCRALGATVHEVRRDTETGDLACERVIECAGTQAALDRAAQLVAVRGRLVIAGFHQDGPRTIDLQSWNWRGLDVANAHERDEAVVVDAMREAAMLAADGVILLDTLVTHRYPLDELAAAFEAARARPDGFVKAWLAA
jgi:threonine dehydrogenase-like Zn-dependent dehydrogenase